jgi:Rrf2 family protein
MLKLTRRADYGLIALTHLAARGRRESASAKEIAERYRIPLPLLSKVLQQLGRSGLVNAEQGTRGGYRLARDPQAISALDVIRAIDGPITLTSCISAVDDCDHTDRCSVRQPLRKVHDGIVRLLADITIGEMADEESRQEPVDKRLAVLS